jgi:universal stress protein A
VKARTILVPIDFSSNSDRALDYAAGVAEVFGSTLHLLHAYHLPSMATSPHDYAVPPAVWDGVREAARRELEERREKVEARGLQVEAHLARGIASDAIRAAAEKLGADLIVMGTRGRTGLAHVLLGSVAERTLRSAPCPVLTVREGVD